jgi:hypothetical protein
MQELNDYSGEFNQDLKLTDFSKEALIQLVRAAAKCYGAQTAFWYAAAKELYGKETADKLQEHVWLKGGASETELRNVCTALKISGHDIANYFKFLQMTPIDATMMDLDFELKDANHGTLTVTRCYSLLLWERTGETELQKNICEVVDGHGFQLGGTWFNPRMKVRPVKLPPRQNRNDICCKWEFVMEQG